MSGIAAVFGTPAPLEERHVGDMLERLRTRGSDLRRLWHGDVAVLAVCRAGWELGSDFAGGAGVLEEDHLVVAADAAIYYRADLERALRSAGVIPRGDAPSQLIAAGYRAWGEGVLDRLEGDFAFVLWDRHRRRLLAARDFAGTRPLYFAHVGERLLLASGLPAMVSHPAVSREFNRVALAEDLIGSSSMAVEETAFAAVRCLPAGFCLIWEPSGPPVLRRFWEPPLFDQDGGPGFDAAAEELRAVLGAAVRERLAGDGPTAVWTSGGYDSPAVLALARRERADVVPVSMSYPPGDPGREDELIAAVGRHLDTPIHWVPVAQVPGLPEPQAWAERRDDPFAHPYEEWNRSLAAASRQAGARVILGGNGGDQFFGVSPVFLADLFRGGHWRELWRQARAIGLGWRHARELFHWAVQPALSPSLLSLARVLRRGRALRAHLQSPVPAWLGLDRRIAKAVQERQWRYGCRREGETLGSAETSWYLTSSFGPRLASNVVGFAQQVGVEARSPMYDRRVLEFMARRPRVDRFEGGQTKRLLRHALVGLLPDEHLAPRAARTGLPTSYLKRVRAEALPNWFLAAGKGLRLEGLGLVGGRELQATMQRYLANPEGEQRQGGVLFNLFSLEFWVRAHGVVDSPSAVPGGCDHV